MGRTHYEESENSVFAQGAHTLVAARLGYDAQRWRITLFGENLTGERYYALIIPGVGHATPGTPRSWGVEFALKL